MCRGITIGSAMQEAFVVDRMNINGLSYPVTETDAGAITLERQKLRSDFLIAFESTALILNATTHTEDASSFVRMWSRRFYHLQQRNCSTWNNSHFRNWKSVRVLKHCLFYARVLWTKYPNPESANYQILQLPDYQIP
jgi:hypothetical protein